MLGAGQSGKAARVAGHSHAAEPAAWLVGQL